MVLPCLCTEWWSVSFLLCVNKPAPWPLGPSSTAFPRMFYALYSESCRRPWLERHWRQSLTSETRRKSLVWCVRDLKLITVDNVTVEFDFIQARKPRFHIQIGEIKRMTGEITQRPNTCNLHRAIISKQNISSLQIPANDTRTQVKFTSRAMWKVQTPNQVNPKVSRLSYTCW